MITEHKSSVVRFIESSCYYSKTFSIVTEIGDFKVFTISVYDEGSKHLIEYHRDLTADEAETLFEKLKAKYIFDYQKALVANQ